MERRTGERLARVRDDAVVRERRMGNELEPLARHVATDAVVFLSEPLRERQRAAMDGMTSEAFRPVIGRRLGRRRLKMRIVASDAVEMTATCQVTPA
jgi:hypothetical protein